MKTTTLCATAICTVFATAAHAQVRGEEVLPSADMLNRTWTPPTLNALAAKLMGTSDQVPAWASTHPDPASRELRARSMRRQKLEAFSVVSGTIMSAATSVKERRSRAVKVALRPATD